MPRPYQSRYSGAEIDQAVTRAAAASDHIANTDIHVTEADKETWDETGADLTGHVANRVNPHVVTCEQIGAAAATDLASTLDTRGSKNLLSVTTGTWNVNGITFTAYDDGTITIDGTATAMFSEIICTFTYPFSLLHDGETHYLSGCPEGGNYTTGYALYCAYIRNGITFAKDVGSGFAFSVPSEAFTTRILVRNGVTVNNLVFKPMICEKNLYDISNDFVPYSPTTSDLQKQIDSLTARIAALET